MKTVRTIGSTAPIIVVGVDRSSREVLLYGLARAQELGGTLRVVHSYRVPRTTPSSPYAEDVRLTFEAGAQDVLDRARDLLRAQGRLVPTEYVLVEGRAAPALLDASRDATEIVLGQDDPTWASRFFEGQVCQRVVAAAPCRIVVVPEQYAAALTTTMEAK